MLRTSTTSLCKHELISMFKYIPCLLSLEPGARHHPGRFSRVSLRAVAACVRLVPAGSTEGAGVVPEDGADHFPFVWFQPVRPVHRHRLSVLLTEAAASRGGPGAAAGVRLAAHWAGLRGVFTLPSPGGVSDEAPGGCCFLLGALGVCESPVIPGAVPQPLQHSAKVHVVMPHVEAALVLSLHCCHFWGKYAECAHRAGAVFIQVSKVQQCLDAVRRRQGVCRGLWGVLLSQGHTFISDGFDTCTCWGVRQSSDTLISIANIVSTQHTHTRHTNTYPKLKRHSQ